MTSQDITRQDKTRQFESHAAWMKHHVQILIDSDASVLVQMYSLLVSMMMLVNLMSMQMSVLMYHVQILISTFLLRMLKRHTRIPSILIPMSTYSMTYFKSA